MFGIAKKKLVVAAVALGAATFCSSRNAAWAITPQTLTDGNSSITFDPATASGVAWNVDGVNEFGGTPAGGDTITYQSDSSAFASLLGLTVDSYNVSGNIGTAQLSGTVGGDNFTLVIKEILTGGSKGSGASAIAETITVNNLGSSPLDFVLHDQFNANLNATPNNDTLTLSPSISPNTATQTDPTGVKLTYSSTPTPNLHELIGSTIDQVGVGPQTGDEQFQFEWVLDIAPGDTGIISNAISLSGQGSGTTTTVAAPNSALTALVALTGLGVYGLIRKSRRAIV